jgi:hypothetical protein
VFDHHIPSAASGQLTAAAEGPFQALVIADS